MDPPPDRQRRILRPLLDRPGSLRPSIENVRKQSTTNRQGGDEAIDVGTAEDFLDFSDSSPLRAVSGTDGAGVAREIAGPRCR